MKSRTDSDWQSKFFNKIVVGDSRVLLKEIPDESVNLVITSPPYYLQRDYGVAGEIGNEDTVEEYVENLMHVFGECLRVLRHDGHIVFNLGDKYVDGSLLLVPWRFALSVLNRFPVKLVNAVTWVKLNPTPRQYRRRLVSSTEPFFDFVKSSNYYFDLDSYLSMHSLLRRRSRTSPRLGQRYRRLIENSELTRAQKEQALRELERVIEEVRSGKIAGFRMKIRGIHAPAFGGQDGGRKIQLEKKGFTIIRLLGNGIKRDVIESPVETIRGIGHPAIFPEFVVSQLVQLLCPPEGVVLDPFMGSGTTAVVARALGRHFVGIDTNSQYVELAAKRVEGSDGMLDYLL
ncbi:MAG: DNA-methyltransferase [Candidatus Thorarchaeota archaeon]